MIKKKLLYAASLFCLTSQALAIENYIDYPVAPRPVPTSFLEFQVLEGAIRFDNSNIEKAAIATNAEGKCVGLEVTIKREFIKDLEMLTENAIHKKINLVMNKRIVAISNVPSSLGRKFLITSLPQAEALAFLNTLDYFKNRQRI